MDWFEIITENYLSLCGLPRAELASLCETYRVVPHGVSLSVGGVDKLDESYLELLRVLVKHIDAPWASDHLCWTGVGGVDLHDLLPLPYNAHTLSHVVERVKRVQNELGVPFALENASSYLEFRESTMPECDYLGELAEQADCGLLIDVNNIFVNAFNHGFDARAYIDSIPPDRVVQLHLAGHTNKGSYLLDTHSDYVRPEVWELFRHAIRRFGPVSTLIEWDANIPAWEELAEEAAKARAILDEIGIASDERSTWVSAT